MRRVLVGCVAILLLFMLHAGRGLALCESSSFEAHIQSADIILAGTLDRSEAVRVSGSIVTRFHFSHIRYVKGTGPKDEFVLSQKGGRIGDSEIRAEDAQDFRVGRRYVAYAHKGEGSDRSRYYTLPACGTSQFGIWAETPSGPPVVHVGNGGPLLAVRDRYLLLLRDQSWESMYPATGYVAFEKPAKRSLDEELRTADSTYAADQARQDPPGGVRLFGLWPHQDPGARVEEGPFIDWLARVVAETSGTKGSTNPPK